MWYAREAPEKKNTTALLRTGSAVTHSHQPLASAAAAPIPFQSSVKRSSLIHVSAPRAPSSLTHTPARHVSCAFDFGTSRGIFWLLLRFSSLSNGGSRCASRGPLVFSTAQIGLYHSLWTGPGRSLPHDRAISSILSAPLRRLDWVQVKMMAACKTHSLSYDLLRARSRRLMQVMLVPLSSMLATSFEGCIGGCAMA